MLARDLRTLGFHSNIDLSVAEGRKALSSLPESKAVYAIFGDGEVRYPAGSSNIVHIGSATNNFGGLRMRIRQYLHPGHLQRTNLRILDFIIRHGHVGLAWMSIPDSETALRLERTLLYDFRMEHGAEPRPPQL